LTAEQEAAHIAAGRQASIRFRVPANRTYVFNDMVKGEVSISTDDMGDFVIVKKDGIPTYNYAVVIDDHLMAISHVLRGDDHINNTPRQLMIYEAFGWQPPVFGHMTLIVNEQHKKLSKRDESIIQFIEQYHDLGYLPEALFNFIALLGWSPGGENEIFSADELIAAFTADRLSKSTAVFDTAKLAWMNNHYIKKAELSTVVALALPHLQKQGWVPATLSAEQQAWVEQLVALFQDRLHCGAEIVEHAKLFFSDVVEVEEEAKVVLAEEQVPQVLAAFKAQLVAADTFDVDTIKTCIKAVQTETGFKGKQLFMPIRAALTGQTHGADLNLSLVLLGRDKVLARL
jgi:nondiscriminating glutamyl-tRNA synthetase